MTVVYGILLAIVASLIGSIGTIIVKKSYSNFATNSLKSFRNNYSFLFGLAIYIGASLISIIALKYGPISLIYPVGATTYIWISLFSAIFLNEKINKYKSLGVFLVILAVIILGVWG
ncbi:MAG: EamA family transporter [Candidatus Woesearchaeota archaeon]|nr:MAG: EamA family transporter [Candidatus Woesearchaeota archaeon]